MCADETVARRALPLLDLTSLNDDDTEAAIERLCARARAPLGQVAAVCVYPRFVKLCRAALAGSGVRVACVANFPAGTGTRDMVAAEVARAVVDGADEVDVVLPYSALLAGDRRTPADLVSACREACGDQAWLKVILETGVLKTRDRIAEASRIAIDNGADFIKTSTGKVQPGATLDAARVMLDAIHSALFAERRIGFKAASGIRTLGQAAAYLGLADEIMGPGWATPATFRFGASGLIDAILQALGVKQGASPRPNTY